MWVWLCRPRHPCPIASELVGESGFFYERCFVPVFWSNSVETCLHDNYNHNTGTILTMEEKVSCEISPSLKRCKCFQGHKHLPQQACTLGIPLPPSPFKATWYSYLTGLKIQTFRNRFYVRLDIHVFKLMPNAKVQHMWHLTHNPVVLRVSYCVNGAGLSTVHLSCLIIGDPIEQIIDWGHNSTHCWNEWL